VQIGRVFLARDMLSHSYDHGLILKMMCIILYMLK